MSATALALRGLSRRFGEVQAVRGLDLDVREGEILGLLGPNGAGKTTTIRMMAGLLKPSGGTVEVYGREVSPARPEARRLVGVCPQENVVYPDLTAFENLDYAGVLFGLARKERRERAERLLGLVGLAEKRDARAAQLSGGMKRRLTVALALVHDPPVVIFDEPEAGLDPQTRVLLRDFVRGLRRERTVVLTSHNMDEVERLADRVAIVDHGRLVALGTPDELKASLAEGDVLELRVAPPEKADALARLVAAHGLGTPRVEGHRVVVTGRGLARRVSAILEAAAKADVQVEDLRLRGATLEDVFIALTGRGLRE